MSILLKFTQLHCGKSYDRVFITAQDLSQKANTLLTGSLQFHYCKPSLRKS